MRALNLITNCAVIPSQGGAIGSAITNGVGRPAIFPGRVAPKGTGLADGSHTSQPGHRHTNEITKAVNPTIFVRSDVQTLFHG